jgi:Fic family protein
MTKWSADKPNNALAPLPPTNYSLTPKQAESLLEVVSLLARLDEASELLANPSVFNNALPMLEISSSSRIENIITTHEEMFVADASTTQPISPETRLAMRNRAALRLGLESIAKRPISAKLLEQVASELLGYQVAVRTLPGTFIGEIGNRVYTPPEGKALVERLLDELVVFIGSSQLHPVLVMILAHYQFEAIHPYPDANGRTGRVLNLLVLQQTGLLQSPVLNLSGYLVRNRDEYYERIHAVEANSDWAGWVDFMLEAIRVATMDSYGKLKELTLKQLEVAEKLHSLVGKFAPSLAQLLFEKPYCQIGHVVTRLGVSRPTASKFLEALVRAGLLTSFVSGKEKFFVNNTMLEVLGR